MATVSWQTLAAHLRDEAPKWVQRLLEEEVTETLGRLRCQRRAAVEGTAGYRNGYGKPRTLSLSSGTLTRKRPRVRGLSERFESRVLPLFGRHTEQVGDLLPERYLHGLSSGDVDLARRGLRGEAAPPSASSPDRLQAVWQAEYEAGKRRPLADLEVVYLWVDGIDVQAGLEKDKAAVLVASAALRDGRKVVLTVEAGARESTEAWSAILRDLQARGMGGPRLVKGDGPLGIGAALANVFPGAQEQRCWNHRIVNVLDKLPKKDQAAARQWLTAIPYARTLEEAERQKKDFQAWCAKRGHAEAGLLLDQDWGRLTTFYAFPREHGRHLRTTNVVESPFAAVRLRTSAAKRYKQVAHATAVIGKPLLVAEKGFRRLSAPEWLAEVAEGAV